MALTTHHSLAPRLEEGPPRLVTWWALPLPLPLPSAYQISLNRLLETHTHTHFPLGMLLGWANGATVLGDRMRKMGNKINILSVKWVTSLKIKLKLLRKIEVNSVHNYAFFTVRKFCHWQPLSLLAPGVQKPSYATARLMTTIKQKAVLWLRPLVTGLSPQRPAFNNRPVDIVCGQVFLRAVPLCHVIIIPSKFHIHSLIHYLRFINLAFDSVVK